jgi:hypothetical protein
MRWKTIVECPLCCGPHTLSWSGLTPPEIGRQHAYRCPTKLQLRIIDARKLPWDVAEGHAGRVIVVGLYGPAPELLELDQSQPY